MTNTSFDLMQASQSIAEHKQPPLDQWNPDFCGDIDMRIAADGQWFYMGTPIGRPAMVKLFSSVLWKERDKYYLKTPVEKVGIEVDDAPFLFVTVEQHQGEKGVELLFTSLTDDQVIAGKDHQLTVEVDPQSGEPKPYIDVRWGMRGLINRSVFYQLVEMAEEMELDGKKHLVVESAGACFSLGVVEE